MELSVFKIDLDFFILNCNNFKLGILWLFEN